MATWARSPPSSRKGFDEGMSQEEILEDFPYLRKEDILACLSYAADREKRLMVVEA